MEGRKERKKERKKEERKKRKKDGRKDKEYMRRQEHQRKKYIYIDRKKINKQTDRQAE